MANYGAFPFPSSSFLVAPFVAVGGDGGIWIDEFSPAHPTSGVDLREGSDVRDTTQRLAKYLQFKKLSVDPSKLRRSEYRPSLGPNGEHFFYPNLPVVGEEEDLLSPFLAAPLPHHGSDLPRLVAQEPEIAHWRSFQDCNQQQHPRRWQQAKTETFRVIGNHSPHARFVFFLVHSLLGRGKVEGYDWACLGSQSIFPNDGFPLRSDQTAKAASFPIMIRE